MSNFFVEGNLQFDFTHCGIAEKFDEDTKNPHGMKSVDFVVEGTDCLYFIEVKDYQKPNASQENKNADIEMLTEAIEPQEKAEAKNRKKKAGTEFPVEIGEKIKDSLLRKYAEGYTFTKKVKFLLVINLDKFGEYERGRLKEKILGHVPTGLNKDKERFHAFTRISFDLVNKQKLMQYGIDCTDMSVD